MDSRSKGTYPMWRTSDQKKFMIRREGAASRFPHQQGIHARTIICNLYLHYTALWLDMCTSLSTSIPTLHYLPCLSVPLSTSTLKIMTGGTLLSSPATHGEKTKKNKKKEKKKNPRSTGLQREAFVSVLTCGFVFCFCQSLMLATPELPFWTGAR